MSAHALERQESLEEFEDAMDHEAAEPALLPCPSPQSSPAANHKDKKKRKKEAVAAELAPSPSPQSSPPTNHKDKKEKKKKDKKLGPFRRRHKSKEPEEEEEARSRSSTRSGHISQLLKKSDFQHSMLGVPRPLYGTGASFSDWSDESGENMESEQDFVDKLVHPTPVRADQPSVPGAPPLASTLGYRPSLQQAKAPTLNGQPSMPTLHYTVSVTLQSGHGLAVRDRTGSSDPYVKAKLGAVRLHRSSIIHRNLNPVWNESFEFQVDKLTTPLRLKVYDFDYGSLDDFMGGASLDLESYSDGQLHIVDIGLEDPSLRGESLGFLRLFLQIRTEEVDPTAALSPKALKRLRRQRPATTQLWQSILTVTLLEGQDLWPMDDNGFSDPYCKFKLGSQKFKSKVVNKSLDPKWKERFELRMYNKDEVASQTLHIEVWDRDFPQSDDFIGGCAIDLSSLAPEKTHEQTLTLRLSPEGLPRGSIRVLLCISGTAVEEGVGEEEEGKEDEVMKEAAKKYTLLRTLDTRAGPLKASIKDIGRLKVSVQRCEGLSSACNSFALVEVGNSSVRTQTVYKSTSPEWRKTFYFNVKDVHDDLELTVFSESKSGKAELLGKIQVPLLRVGNGTCVYALKEKHCISRAAGVVHLDCSLVYNPIRASIRTINPRESKVLEEDAKFQRKMLMGNLKRVVAMSRTFMTSWQFVQGLFRWENTTHSGVAFLVFVLACLLGELWMLPVGLGFVFLYFFLTQYIRGKHQWQTLHKSTSLDSTSTYDSSELSDYSDMDDYITHEDTQESQSSLRHKFRQLHEVLVIVQSVLGYAADLGERVQNLFNWSVPFLCWMAVVLTLGAGLLLYFVPLRYVILVWGINKFTKYLRNPNYINNNELLDYLSRSPTLQQLVGPARTACWLLVGPTLQQLVGPTRAACWLLEDDLASASLLSSPGLAHVSVVPLSSPGCARVFVALCR